MHLKNLSVVNFKNIIESEIELSHRLNCFIGDNGSGKTNLLDAIYYLSFTKSFFNPIDNMNINHSAKWFMLKGEYNRSEDNIQVICSCQDGQKKQVKLNGKTYRRLADHIGLLPLVMVSPGDSVLIMGGSEERRKFMDGVISQFDAAYLDDLLRYNRVLLQRNNILKQLGTGFPVDQDMIAIYDDQLIDAGIRLYERRRKFIDDLNPVFQKYYSAISQGVEKTSLFYQSDLEKKPYKELLQEAFPRDKNFQYTTVGIHKDDLLLSLGNHPIRKIGSQGQQKTYLVALKLAQFVYISQVAGQKPILLLDDIFDKLDKHRVEQIIKMVSGEQFGQIFITDTNREHLDSILLSLSSDYKIFKVANGQINNLQ